MISVTLALFLLAVSVANAQGPPFIIRVTTIASLAQGIDLCVSAPSNSDGAPATIHRCNTEPVDNRSFVFSQLDCQLSPITPDCQSTPPQNIVAFGNKCLDVENGVNANGTPVQWWTCGDKNRNQLWSFLTNFTLQWSGTNKCLDLTNGNIADGTKLQIWDCIQGNGNQIVDGANTISGPSQIHATRGSGPFCIAAESSANGSPVALVTCANTTTTFPNSNSTFVLPNSAVAEPIKTFGGSKCIDVKDGSTVNGNKLQIWDCVDGNTNQLFALDERENHITWVGKNKCFDLTDGSAKDGTPIQIWDCIDGNSNQVWIPS